jgi:dihydropteroate synthase
MVAPDPSSLTWQVRGRAVRFDGPAVIMGILNVTPDSFSDGGRYIEPGPAIERGLQMARDGADILDIGGESSRPGAEPVSTAEEIRRVVPVLTGLAAASDVLLSVDTTKAEVAEQALAAGAHIINDISALHRRSRHGRKWRGDTVPAWCSCTCRAPRAPCRRGLHMAMWWSEVARYLADRVRSLADAGLDPSRVAVDPGLCFGKTVEHNVALLRGLPRLARLGRPVLVGASRKSFLGHLTGRAVDERLAPSLAALAFAVQQGAHILRVHDVKESCEVAYLLAKFGLPTEPPAP